MAIVRKKKEFCAHIKVKKKHSNEKKMPSSGTFDKH